MGGGVPPTSSFPNSWLCQESRGKFLLNQDHGDASQGDGCSQKRVETGHLTQKQIAQDNATYVNLIATQEVTGGIILGYLLLGEVPSFNSLLGAAITLTGIAMVLIQ